MITKRLTLNYHNIDFQKYTNQLDVEIQLSNYKSSSLESSAIFADENVLDKANLLLKKIRLFVFTSTIRYNKFHKLFSFSEKEYSNKPLFVSKINFLFNEIVKLKFPGSKFRVLFIQNPDKNNEFFEYSYKLRLKITLYDKNIYHELTSCLSNFSWRENLAYFSKNFNDSIDLHGVIIKNLQHFNKKYFENVQYQTTLADVFYFLQGKLENLSHHFTLKTNISGEQFNFLLKNNNFKVTIYFKNQVWGTMSIEDTKLIFDYRNMRVSTRYKVTPSYMLNKAMLETDWIKVKHILAYYFKYFF